MRGAAGAAAVLAVLALCPAAAADGDNAARATQGGSASSGDAVGGPVLAVVHAGDLSLRMTNRAGPGAVREREARVVPGAIDVLNEQGPTDVRSGAAEGGSRADVFVGVAVGGGSLDDIFHDVV